MGVVGQERAGAESTVAKAFGTVFAVCAIVLGLGGLGYGIYLGATARAGLESDGFLSMLFWPLTCTAVGLTASALVSTVAAGLAMTVSLARRALERPQPR
jgi:hypothetical protein